ncbi:MAG: hypothetical protein JNM93_03995 [Bacteriovoracaceae bacterium]|nr:hypothetical protein [Bacteriovoracaceae bacterium]
MKHYKLPKYLGFMALFSSYAAFAHPVSYKGATTLMTWSQPFLSDTWLVYSASPNYAFAARTMRMQMKDGEDSYLYMPQFDYLLKRWNETDLQANIYVYGGYGGLRANDKTGTVGLVGFEIDAEDRKYYASLKYESMFSSLGEDIQQTVVRVGIAPYEAEYNELTSWFMLQAQYHPNLAREFALTPLARFFYKSALLEAGSSFKGDWMINLMFHF